ncbi:MAG: hypothetical protein E2O39_01780 [Planctomycetota bacterium]|nr:MAG: hypothetical protein E2O39_01780 [Planctomycetota bacterium]
MRRALLGASLLGVLCLAGACSAPAPRAGMRRLDELPPRFAESWRAWLEQDPAWPEIRAEALSEPALARFLVDNLTRQMMGNYADSRLAPLGDARIGRFERARADLLVMHDYSVPVLVELLAIGNSQVDALVTDLLLAIGRPAIMPLVSLLERKEPNEARMRAARLLGDLPYALADEDAVRAALIRRLAEDSEWLVRSKAASALGERGARDRRTADTREALIRGLDDEDHAVTRSSALALRTLRDPQAIPALIVYLERTVLEGDVISLRAVQRTLRSLSGEPRDMRPRGWRAWWRDHRPAPVHSRTLR